jgi:hypothetical protein
MIGPGEDLEAVFENAQIVKASKVNIYCIVS